MAIPGSKPKPTGQTRHRNRSQHDWVEVEDVPFRGAPELPTRTPQGKSWPTPTVQWWKVISTMPHCRTWAPSDWEFAFDTAALKAEFHVKGGNTLAAEVRNREKVLGTTADYRRDQRIRYVPAGRRTSLPENVTSLESYRDL